VDPRRREQLTRYGAPAAFLAAVTIAAILVKAGLNGSSTTTVAITSSSTARTTTAVTTTTKLVLTAPPGSTTRKARASTAGTPDAGALAPGAAAGVTIVPRRRSGRSVRSAFKGA